MNQSQESSGKRGYGVVRQFIAEQNDVHLNEHTVRCWYARYKMTQDGERAEKQQAKVEKRYRSRAKLTLKEEYILEKILRWSLMEACFPKKEQILVLVNQMTDDRVPMTKTTWEWIRRWLHRRGFSYKKITTRSTGQFLNIGKIEEINQFYTLLYATYYRNKEIFSPRIWIMDECAFADSDGTRRGWGIRGGDGQVVAKATNHRDTLVATVAHDGGTATFFSVIRRRRRSPRMTMVQ